MLKEQESQNNLHSINVVEKAKKLAEVQLSEK